jgi:hypothetical protein
MTWRAISVSPCLLLELVDAYRAVVREAAEGVGLTGGGARHVVVAQVEFETKM